MLLQVVITVLRVRYGPLPRVHPDITVELGLHKLLQTSLLMLTSVQKAITVRWERQNPSRVLRERTVTSPG